MKTWRLVSGILSIVMAVFVVFQALAVGTANALMGSSDISGSIGLIVAFLMIAGGIVSIVMRNCGRAGYITTLLIFGIAAAGGQNYTANYPDLAIWVGWCFICAVLSLIGWIILITKKKKQ